VALPTPSQLAVGFHMTVLQVTVFQLTVLAFRVRDLGLRVDGSGCMVPEFRMYRVEFRV